MSRIERARQKVLNVLVAERCLAPEDRAAFAEEVAAFNQRRVRQLVPFITLIHLLVGLQIIGVPASLAK